MEPDIHNVAQPDLLRYLSGEITFENWLETQQQPEFARNSPLKAASATYVGDSSSSSHVMLDVDQDSSSIFSSWGNAFTSKPAEPPKTNPPEDLSEDEDEDEEDDDDAYTETNPSNEPVSGNQFLLPDISAILPYNPDDQQIQGSQLIPFMESLQHLMPSSTIRQCSRKQRKDEEVEPTDIMKDFHNFQLRKRKKKGAHSIHNKLPELCRLQMGQANLLVAKGDFKQAANICMEVVREAPNSGIPFKTLAFIYEEQGNKELSLQYSLISAFLDCKDWQEWKDLSKRCMEAGNIKQAMACHDRACKHNPNNISLQWERASLYFQGQEFRKALDIYQQILKCLIPIEQFTYIQLAKDMAKFYYQHGLTDKAGDTLEVSFNNCPGYKDHEGINLLCEIYLGSKKYNQVLKVISTTYVVNFQAEQENLHEHDNAAIQSIENQSLQNLNLFINKALNSEDFKDLTSAVTSSNMTNMAASSEMITSVIQGSTTESISRKEFTTLQPVNSKPICEDYKISEDIPLDIRIKLAVCLIHQGRFTGIEVLIQPLLTEDVEIVGDLVLDIAEAFFEMGQYEEALKYLLDLVESEKFNQAAVWLKIAECYESLGNTKESIDAYYQVLTLAPLQASVRLTLASQLRAIGRNEDAITVLAEYEEACVDEEGEDITISQENRLKIEEYEDWYRKCLSMHQTNRLRDFIFHGYILMYNYLLSGYMHQRKQTVGKIHFWEFMLKILNVSVKLKEYKKANNLLEQAMLFKPYAESKKYRLELDYLQTTLYYISGEYSKAFDAFRLLLMHENERVIQRNAIWNLFTQIANKMLDKRHHRFTLRLLFKRPKLIPLIIHNGNNSHLCGTYKYAIGEFSRAFREWPTYPLNSMLLGISFLHLSCQKFHKTRHTSILHGLIFMFQYFNLRDGNQEAYYNVARAFHQIGLVHLAAYYYNKALEFPLYQEKQEMSPPKISYHHYIDLHREAAYNLSLIYRASGNLELARKTLYKYCWV